MPYASIAELPPAVKERYSPRCQAVFMRAYNAHDGDEASRFKVAHTAAGNCKAAGKAMIEPKAAIPVKAQLMDADELEAWFAGKIPRRILSLPFGGPIPSAKSSLGVDLDGEWFGPDLDPYGPHKALRETRDRLVDFHHSFAPPGAGYGDPTGVMRGVILGKSVLDPEPEEDGYWSDIWLRYGEKRLALVKSLVKRGGQLFGSSQPASGVVKDPETGEIKVWPHLLQTLSPSPQNTYSVLRPKAMLDAIDSTPFPVHDALKAFLSDLDNLGADLPLTSYLDGDRGDVAAKAGRVLSARNERALRDALALIQKHLDEMAGVPTEPPTEGDASN